jgi:quercetin dioxygenase-like cupin family protein
LKRLIVASLILLSTSAMAQQKFAPHAITGAPTITDAPGRGEIDTVHTGAFPSVFELDKQPMEQISPQVQRQFLSGSQTTIAKWMVKAGGVFALHHHANEQVTWITKGRCEVYTEGKKIVLTAGMVMIVPPNVPHEFLCTEDSIDIDFFSPQRQDWMDGVASAAAVPAPGK